MALHLGPSTSGPLRWGKMTTSTVYDTANAQSWAQITTVTDAQGRLDTRTVWYDDGTRVDTDWDQTGIQAWSTRSTTYSPRRRPPSTTTGTRTRCSSNHRSADPSGLVRGRRAPLRRPEPFPSNRIHGKCSSDRGLAALRERTMVELTSVQRQELRQSAAEWRPQPSALNQTEDSQRGAVVEFSGHGPDRQRHRWI